MCIFTDHVPHCLFSINIEFHKKLITPVLALFVFVLGRDTYVVAAVGSDVSGEQAVGRPPLQKIGKSDSWSLDKH